MLKLLFKQNILILSIILFITLFTTISYIKPNILFNIDGSIRDFGLNSNKKTIIPIWLLTICLSIISYISIRYITIII